MNTFLNQRSVFPQLWAGRRLAVNQGQRRRHQPHLDPRQMKQLPLHTFALAKPWIEKDNLLFVTKIDINYAHKNDEEVTKMVVLTVSMLRKIYQE